jgi:hypothetical protein
MDRNNCNYTQYANGKKTARKQLKIAFVGGSGQVGTMLADQFHTTRQDISGDCEAGDRC